MSYPTIRIYTVEIGNGLHTELDDRLVTTSAEEAIEFIKPYWDDAVADNDDEETEDDMPDKKSLITQGAGKWPVLYNTYDDCTYVNVYVNEVIAP